MREIVFDTETTGLSPLSGDRVVEIGCVEIINRFPTGKTFHRYINPQRDMPDGAFRVHGLSAEFLSAHPTFDKIADEFVAFIGDDPLIAHNSDFDIGFINMEFKKLNKPPVHGARVINTLLLARRKHPGASNRLDDLCVRYKIDNSKRELHGALLDAQLLAEVYIELIGGRQAAMVLSMQSEAVETARRRQTGFLPRPTPLNLHVSDAEREAHLQHVESLGAAALWNAYA